MLGHEILFPIEDASHKFKALCPGQFFTDWRRSVLMLKVSADSAMSMETGVLWPYGPEAGVKLRKVTIRVTT